MKQKLTGGISKMTSKRMANKETQQQTQYKANQGISKNVCRSWNCYGC
jgi:hypothetical protein